MNRQRPFVRKIVYVCLIVVLLFPLSWLSKPATSGDPARGVPGDAGGFLSRQRQKSGLSQANLGEIDARGESVKLAMFGMRGVAANILWHQAEEFKKKKDWNNYRVTLDKISKLQPNFIAVWRFQAWNLSYNIAAEWDDYRDRYHWVKEGIKFIEGGVKYNRKEPRLIADIGWFTGQKIGRADEKKQYRRLFADPEDDLYNYLNAALPPDPLGVFYRRERRDNWLMGKWYYRSAEMLLQREGVPLRGVTPHIFHSHPPLWQFNYAKALEYDGTFGEVAKEEWRTAAAEWDEYGRHPFLESDGQPFGLNDYEPTVAKAKSLSADLDALAPELRGRIEDEKRARLTDEQREALDTPYGERTQEQFMLANDAQQLIRVYDSEVAGRIDGTPQEKKKAIDLAHQATDARELSIAIARLRNVINFESWRLRAEVEQTEDALEARRLLYDAEKEDLDLELKRDLFEEGLAKWKAVLDKYPGMVTDTESGDDVVDYIRKYKVVLGRLDQPFPEDFMLQELLDRYGDE